jgi:hypothetical protein
MLEVLDRRDDAGWMQKSGAGAAALTAPAVCPEHRGRAKNE